MKKLLFQFSILTLLIGIFGCDKTCDLPAPTALVANNITANTVDLSWGAVSGAASYDIVVSEAPTLANAGKVVLTENTKNTTFSVTTLSASKAYIAKVTARCNKKSLGSSNTGTVNFSTTTSACDLAAVTNLTATAVSPTKVSVNFTLITGAQSYKIDIFSTTVPKVLITSKVVQQVPEILSGLVPGTAYEVVVSAGCTPTSFSTNTAKVDFVTPIIIDDDIVMFGSKVVGGDSNFDNPCNVGSNNNMVSLGGPTKINITDNGIHYIKITDNAGVVKCEFRLANHYVAAMNVMKFCYKDTCPDTAPIEEPLKDSSTSTLYFDLNTSTTQMILNVTRTDISITIPAMGYKLFTESQKW